MIVFLILFLGSTSLFPGGDRACSGILGVLSLFIAWQVTKRYRGQDASSAGGNIIMGEDSDSTVENEDED